MPSATTTVKPEKQQQQPAKAQPEESHVAQISTIIEKKIRNLEKRKQRLEGYKELEAKGKTLTEQQLEAISHVADVEQQIDSTRDLLKQVTQVAQEYNRHMKLKKKQDLKERSQGEQAKIRELLQVQDILNRFGTEAVREDFRTGVNGAITLSENELLLLDGIYTLVMPSSGAAAEAGKPWSTVLDEAAAHGYSLITASSRKVEVNGASTTYKELKKLVTAIIQCPYISDESESRSTTPEGNPGESSASSTCEQPGGQQPQSISDTPAAAEQSAELSGALQTTEHVDTEPTEQSDTTTNGFPVEAPTNEAISFMQPDESVLKHQPTEHLEFNRSEFPSQGDSTGPVDTFDPQPFDNGDQHGFRGGHGGAVFTRGGGSRPPFNNRGGRGGGGGRGGRGSGRPYRGGNSGGGYRGGRGAPRGTAAY